jgi:hypothetical protein
MWKYEANKFFFIIYFIMFTKYISVVKNVAVGVWNNLINQVI